MRRSRRTAVLVAVVLMLIPAVAGADDFADAEARGWLWMYLGSFGAGFATSLTPCVYPMIPITLAIFGARGQDVSRRRAMALATAYVLGMGATYAVLGVSFALIFGAAGFGAQLAHPGLVYPLVALFILLAASMFGAFELNLPAGLQARLSQVGGKGYRGAFAMGLVGGLIAAPCTGPFLGGLLIFVSTSGSVFGGGSLLFVYAIGMGVLFWLLAAFAMSLPKSGAWMDSVKSVGGVGLLFVAMYLMRPLFPQLRTFASPEHWFLLLAIGLTVLGIAAGAIHLSFHGSLGHKLRKGFGLALLLAGAFGAYTWKLTPKQRLPWITDEQAAYAQARAAHKGVMVDFAAAWCEPCEELELTFGDDEVYDAITSHFVPLKLDVTEGDEHDQAKRNRYGAVTLPSVVFLDPDGNVLGRVNKMIEPDAMLDVVRPAARRLRSSQRAQTP